MFEEATDSDVENLLKIPITHELNIVTFTRLQLYIYLYRGIRNA